MSTRTFPTQISHSSNGSPSPLIAAIVLSIILHVAGLAGVLSFGPTADKLRALLMPKDEGPIIVDVIELPPDAYSSGRLKKPARYYSDRTQGVERETVPAPFGGRRESPVRKAFPGLDAASREAWTNPIHPAEAAKDKNGGLSNGTTHGEFGLPGKTGDATKTVPAQRPSLFPSEERLGELERRYEAEAPAGEQGKTLSLNTSELRYQKYLINMKNRIELKWEYPFAASRNGWQGNLQIDFTINKDGTVADIKLVKSSNYPVLDDAAITALRLASPFPPFPAGFSVEEINIKGQFSYIIYDKFNGPGR
ncbi:MAG: energy transducer TonB [Deltaproteobacteria bacterium]|nr:energy transducer TonB [Deltaproteobacteria bacterium]